MCAPPPPNSLNSCHNALSRLDSCRRLDLPRQEIRLCNRTSIAFEAFRFDDLGFFYGMAERVGILRRWG